MLLSQVLPYSVCKSGNKIVIEQNAQTISIVLNVVPQVSSFPAWIHKSHKICQVFASYFF